jgi:hypothetical protein
MSNIRRWHFEQLHYALKTVAYILQSVSAQDLITYRDNHDGWTVAEVLGHLLNSDWLFLERATLIMTQDKPELPSLDPAEEVRKGCYNERDPQAIFAEWQQARAEYLAYLADIPDEGWNREGGNPNYPLFSLNDQLSLVCWHDQVHIEQMTRILTEKKL